ncbi:MAG: FimV family protein [Burkholderiales bacterium]
MPFKKTIIASLLAAAAFSSQGAGLGRLTIVSSLGQPLHAEIDLIAISTEEFPSLDARLASLEIYSREDVRFDPALTGARVTLMRRSDGQPYLRITSNRPLTEPFVDLLIEVSSNGGRFLRSYSALIDPPGYAADVKVNPPVITVAPSAIAPDARIAESEHAVSTGSIAASAASGSEARASDTDRASNIERASNTEASAAPNASASPKQVLQGLVQENMNVAISENIRRLVEPIDRVKRPDAVRQAARPSTSPATGGVLRLAPTEVRPDPIRDAAEKVLADRGRALEVQLLAKKMELKEIDERIALLQSEELNERIHSLETMVAARRNSLGIVDAQIRELLATFAKGDSTAGSNPATANMNAPTIENAAPASVASNEVGMTRNPLLIGGSALVLAIAGGLGTWRIRRRAHAEPAGAASLPTGSAAALSDTEAMEHFRSIRIGDATEPATNLDPQVKVLEQLAQDKNVEEFNRRAQEIAEVTGREGAVWEQIAAMGFVLDRSNSLYSAVPGALASAVNTPDGPGLRRMTADGTPILEFPSDWLAKEGERGPAAPPTVKADSMDVATDFLGPDFSLDAVHGKSMAIAPAETPMGDPSKGRVPAAATPVAEPKLQLEAS